MFIKLSPVETDSCMDETIVRIVKMEFKSSTTQVLEPEFLNSGKR